MSNRAIFPYNYQIHMVGNDGRIIETLAECNNWDVAYGAYKLCQQTRAHAFVQLREKSRVVWTAKTGAYDTKTRKIEVIWEK